MRYLPILFFCIFHSIAFSGEWWEVTLSSSSISQSQYPTGSVWSAPAFTTNSACSQFLFANSSLDPSTYQSSIEITTNYSCRYKSISSSSWTTWIRFNPRSGTCPLSLPYEHPDGVCYTEPPPEPCPIGQVDSGNGCEDVCQPTTGFKNYAWYFLGSAPGQIDTSGYPEFSCVATFSGISECTESGSTFLCRYEYTDTGQAVEPFQVEGPEPQPTSDPLPPLKTEKTVDGPTTTASGTDPEVIESTTTTTTTQDTGYTYETIGDSVVIKNHSGEIIEIVEQKTINVYSDGSGTETTQTTINATPSTITSTDGIDTWTDTKGQSGTQTTSTTKTFGPGGVPTGSTTTTTGDGIKTAPGQGPGGEGTGGESGGGFCTYAQIVCDAIDWITEPWEEPEPLEAPIVDLELPEFSSGIGIVSCPAPMNVVTRYGTIQISWEWVCQLAELIRPVVIAFSWIIGLFMVVRGTK